MIRDAQDTATTPTGLVGLSATLFYGLRPGCSTSCSDAVQAYLQAPIGDDTWCVIPVELWLPSWFEKYPPTTKLVVRLNKSLYGHPESGQCWQKHLEKRLRAIGGTESPEYPSTWFFTRGGRTLVLNVCVDDLTLSGPTELHAPFWTQLRKSVKFDPEVFIQGGKEGCRILGRHHSCVKDQLVATCEFDMRSYAEQLVEFYCEIASISPDKLR